VSIRDLLQWQWSGYAKYHTSRLNLLIHIVAVPLFLAGNAGLAVTLLRRSWLLATACLVATVVSLAIQGRGHRTERVPPEPFTGAGNAVARIMLEQWITFPRYVASGGWLRALRDAAPAQRRR
jgi:hypothetical protein